MAEYNADLRQDWGAVASLLNWERGLQADKREQEEQAIRWQGEQDYKTLVDSGVDPMEALRRTATKLFHNRPREMSGAVEGAAEGMRRKALEGDPITKTMPDGTVFMRTLNGWTQVHIPVPREEIRPFSKYNKDTGVRQTFTAPEYADQERQDAITSELDIYKKAKAPSRWSFSGNPSDPNQMTISSNRLAQAGMNAQTGKEFPTSFTGASGGPAPAATPEMIAAFKSLPQTAPTAPGPAQMPQVTPAQARAAIKLRAQTGSRPVGQKRITNKGTFVWDGKFWQPLPGR